METDMPDNMRSVKFYSKDGAGIPGYATSSMICTMFPVLGDMLW
ncbi:unnamed protein product [Caretta caretta]